MSSTTAAAPSAISYTSFSHHLAMFLSIVVLLLRPVHSLSLSSPLSGMNVKVLSNQEKHLASAPRLLDDKIQPHYYVTPDNPAKIACTADHASYVTIHCNQKVLGKPINIIADHERPERQSFSVTINFKEVMEWFDNKEFFCNCEAWNRMPELKNEYRKIVSKNMIIRLSYFETQRFQFDPLSQNISLDSRNAHLYCIPPMANPKPKIRWMKDGKLMDLSKFSNRITVDHQDSLIISKLSVEDRGNYSCVAEIPGQKIVSKPGYLNIYVNGMWSIWSLWDSCPSGCIRDSVCPDVCFSTKRKRRRSCSHPSPIHGGKNCDGVAVETEPCDRDCVVDGRWSEWSTWSFCSADCRSHRERSCSGTRNGGRSCPMSGPDGTTQTRNCTGNQCNRRPEDAALLKYFNGEKKEVPTNHLYSVHDIAMYVGLFVAVAVLVTVAVVIVYLVRRKTVSFTAGRRVNRYIVQMNGNKYPNDKDSNHTGLTHEMLLPPDNGPTVTIKNHNAMDMQMMSSYKSPPHEQALRVQLPVTSSTYLSPHEDKSRPASGLYHELSLGCQSHDFFNYVPHNFNAENMAWGSVNSSGGRLCLPESGVSLTIPIATITTGHSEELFLAVCRDDKDKPRLSDKQTLLSPVVIFGPPCVPLMKHVILSLPHSACLSQGFWNITVLHCDSSGDEPIRWREHFKVGSESVTTPGYCQMDSTVCHLMLEDVGRYCLIGQSLEGGSAVKYLRLAAFAAPLQSSPDFTLRLYILSDTNEAFESVVQMEQQHGGGQLMDTPKQLLFKDGGQNLCFNIEELSLGWRFKSKYQEIPFQHVWNGNQSGVLHCSFSLEHVDPTRQSVSCKIVAYQNQFYSNRQVVHIVSNKNDLPVAISPNAYSQPSISHGGGSNILVPCMDPIQTGFRLSPQIRKSICMLMDTPNPRGNDWRMLARHLGVDRYITYFATKTSPTECILDLWEARHREESALKELIALLKSMCRNDVANILEQDPNAWC